MSVKVLLLSSIILGRLVLLPIMVDSVQFSSLQTYTCQYKL